ncbi:MAG TPA: hypothetical protein ENL42_04295 [Thermoplasmatales archaeon]|nr:hypothetical protein [Thermoplasmatales archaeon]
MVNEIILVGVGHVFRLGEKIKEIISIEEPDAIALELDTFRAHALLNRSEKQKRKMQKDPLYFLLALSQDIIAKKFNVVAGDEMLAAMKYAMEKDIPVYYIDMDVRKVMENLRRALSFKKKLSLLCSLLLSLFIRKKDVENEIKKIESEEEYFLKVLEREYPEIKNILIDKRNEFMVERLKEIMKYYDKIVVIVGEGHIYGMQTLLNDASISVKTIHLKDLLT